MKLLLILIFVGGGALAGGFLQFTSKVSDTVQPINVEPADAIVALTGGSTRIATALELLSEKKGQRLLISGVNSETQTADIQAMHPTKSDLFDCCVDLERIAVNTIGNAEESAKWAKQNSYKSLIIVTSAYHMPRSLLEYRRQMPGVKLTPFAVPLDSINREEWWKNTTTLRLMIYEYWKYVVAYSRNYFPQIYEALRKNLLGDKQN